MSEISGKRQYDHNAIIVTYDPPITLSGPIFLSNAENVPEWVKNTAGWWAT